MPKAAWARNSGRLLRVGQDFRLADVDTGSTPGFSGDKHGAAKLLADDAGELDELQQKLFAQSRFGGSRSLLLVLQAMDTGGKGGIVRHVVGAVNPQGVKAYAFKAPTRAERRHDFLWRVRRQLPPPGYIGVFDRSHYEDVLVPRVRGSLAPEAIDARYGAINDFETETVASGTALVKVLLHIGFDEQKERLAQRLSRRDKYWKYNPDDIAARSRWPAYQEAYQALLDRTSTASAPWYVVPADHKYYARIAVQRLLLIALRGMELQWPEAHFDVRAEKKRLAAS